MATHTTTDFTIHEDEDPFAATAGSSSPGRRCDATEEDYEADDSVLTSDEVFPSVEHDTENLPKTLPSSPPGGTVTVKITPRCISSATKSSRHSAVSSLPGSVPFDDRDISPYIPMKKRPVYRDGSMRKLVMSSPPDSYSHSRSSTQLRERVWTSPKSDRRFMSPRSQISHSNSTMHSSRHGTPSVMQTPTKEDHPLVLLHVTVLPQSWPYSLKSMSTVLPDYIIENQQLLEEKLNPTILARGLLLSHPGEEYDLLEERILESLELQIPRIMKCGHYYQEDSELSSSIEDNVTIGRGENTYDCHVARDSSDNMVFDPETHCTTCHQSIGLPGAGAGEGNRKWDIKVYAANGLMRAGAWSAAWKEMEKVDVEIGTWLPDHLRRELDQILEEEEQEAVRAAQLAEEERLRTNMEHQQAVEEQIVREQEELRRSRASGILTPPPEEPPTIRWPKSPTQAEPQAVVDVPLMALLQNYVIILAQDRRNLAIVLLSILVLLVSMRAGGSTISPAPTTNVFTASLPTPVLATDMVASSVSSPSISTSTTFAIATITVTESVSVSESSATLTEVSSTSVVSTVTVTESFSISASPLVPSESVEVLGADSVSAEASTLMNTPQATEIESSERPTSTSIPETVVAEAASVASVDSLVYPGLISVSESLDTSLPIGSSADNRESSSPQSVSTETAFTGTRSLDAASLETASLETESTETASLETASTETASTETASTETASTEIASTDVVAVVDSLETPP